MTLKLQISVLITLNAGIDHKKNAVSIYTQWIKTAFVIKINYMALLFYLLSLQQQSKLHLLSTT